MAFCSACGAQIPAGSTNCPACARSTGGGGPVPQSTTGGMTDNVAGMLAYLFITAIIFLVMEPYNKSRFVRFHSFQCLFCAAVLFVLGIALSIIGSIPILGLVVIPLGFLVWIGSFVLWIVLLLKAYQGQMFKLPIIGDMAEKQANAA